MYLSAVKYGLKKFVNIGTFIAENLAVSGKNLTFEHETRNTKHETYTLYSN